MPTIPTRNLTGNSADILNSIRNMQNVDYKTAVGIAKEGDVSSLRAIGQAFINAPVFQNAFLRALVNRIAFEVIKYRSFHNTLSVFKAGVLDYGETIEEIFVGLCEPHNYNPEVAEDEVFKREKPDVMTAFHTVNYEKFYKQTIEEQMLRRAFLSWTNFDRLITSIIENMVKTADYDEFLVTKYCIARAILDGDMKAVTIPQPTKENSYDVITKIKGISNALLFAPNSYNRARVENGTERENQYLISTADFDATYSTNVLATAFNMSEAEFIGHRVLVDSFSDFNVERLNKLLSDDASYRPFTADELSKLANVPAVLVSKDWFVIYDNLFVNTDNWNGQGLYRNYFLHIWKIFSTSPFENACVFTSDTTAVTSLTVSPDEVTVSAGQTALFTADVITTGFAPKTVIWSIDSDEEGTSIDAYGRLTVSPDTALSSITVTATSTFDSTKKDTATVTINS